MKSIEISLPEEVYDLYEKVSVIKNKKLDDLLQKDLSDLAEIYSDEFNFSF
jgi:hypothetical protein